jgi:diguanylate cyclase (GGDEF)-like protein/PAS domain S-box-containing protein
MIGTDGLQYVHPDDVGRVANTVSEAQDYLGIRSPAEVRYRHKDGSWRWLEVSTNSLTGDPEALSSSDARGALREGERLFWSVVHNSAEVVEIVDRDGTLRYASPAFERLFGYDPEEVVGTMNVLDHVHPDDLPHVLEKTEDALGEGGVARNVAEYRFRHADSSWRHVESVGTYLLNDPTVRGVVVNVRDVSERKQAEWALKESEAMFRAVFGGAAIGMALVDTQRQITESNPALQRMLGHDEEELRGKHFAEVMYPDDVEECTRLFDRLVAGELDHFRLEKRYVRKDGGVMWGLLTSSAVRDGRGELRFMVGMVEDITERKRAEEVLREAEDRYRTLVENIPAIVYVEAMDGRMTTLYDSPQIERMLGYPHDTYEKDPAYWPKIIHPDDKERVLAEERTALAERRPLSSEYRVLTADGRAVWVRDEAVVVRDEQGEPLHWQGFIFDITDRKDAEEALKESEERYRGRTRELLLLHQVRTALAQELDLPSVFHKAVEAVAQAYGYTQVSAYLLEGEGLMLQHEVGYEQVIERIPVTEGVSGRAVRTGRPILLEDVSTDADFLGAIQGATSEICVPLFDEDGAVVGFLNVESTGGVRLTQNDLELMVAVSEHVSVAVSRAQLYTRVRRSEEHFRALTQNSSDIVTLLRADGTIQYQSPSAERILGYHPKEMVGDNAFDYVHPEDLGRVEIAFAEGLKDPRRRPSAEYRFRHKDGSWRWLESVGTNLLGDPGVGGYVVNSRNITRRKEAEEALKNSGERFRSLVQNASDVILIMEPDDTVRYISPAVERVLGYKPDEVVGMPNLIPVHPDDLPQAQELIAEATKNPGTTVTAELRLRHADGSWRHVESRCTSLLGDPAVRGIVFNTRDVTGRKRAEKALRESEQRFRSSFEDAAVGMALVGLDGRWLRVNRSLCEIVGYTEEELLERTFQDVTHPEDLEADLAYVRRVLSGEIRSYQMEKRYFHKSGHAVWILLNSSLVRDEEGDPLYFSAQIQDITGRKHMEARLQEQALHDPLTGLPNRKLFVDRLGRALERTRRRKRSKVAVLFLDLDGFKVINDSLGHGAGDLLLMIMAQRLRRCLRPEDSLARFGGDEFTVLLEDIEGPDDTVSVVERITDELRRPFLLESRELFASGSVGVSLGNARTTSPENLLRDADTAMYRAKEDGVGYRIFDPAMYERAVMRLELENDLRRAMEANEFVVHYQPLIDLQTGKAWGAEALVRWEHPVRGLMLPSEFMPVVEESGLVVPLGESVLEDACRQARGWQGEPRIPPLIVSVNLSARQLQRSDFVLTVREVLRKTGLEANRLSLDVTETAYIRVLENKTAALDRLKALGVRLSIDDFGIGYSSLSYLKRLPADNLNIDRSYLKGLGEDPEDTAIVQMVIELAHTLGMKVVAEGVESAHQSAHLRKMGCDLAQGFYYSEPLSADAMSEFSRK